MHEAQAQLREARASLAGAHTTEGMDHLRTILLKYIEMDEAENGSLFLVLMRLLDYSEAERKRMKYARDRRAARSSLWGRIAGPA